jgi:hypothetical protein
MVQLKLTSVLAASALAAAFMVAGSVPAAATGSYTCPGGSVPAGSYRNLTITGFCAVNAGDVTVANNVTVTPTGGLDGTWAGSTLTVGRNLIVESGGTVFLGCNTKDPCSNDPDPGHPTLSTNHVISGSVVSTGAPFLVIHNDSIGGSVSVDGGGVTYDCSNFAFTDFDVNTIGGNVSISGLRTCWDGFANNVVGGNVDFENNIATIVEPPPVGADGNLVGGNTIARNLSCSGNSPTPHLSDETPVPNSVGGNTSGQCVGES